MTGLALWLLAIGALAALATSLASALGLVSLAPLIERIEPRARARVLLFVSFLPLVVAVLVTGAIVLPHPWLGLPEHCLHHDDDHLHLCLAHGSPAPSIAILALLFALVLRVAVSVTREARVAARAALALRRLAAGTDAGDDLVRLPLDAPLAFTAGWLRPRVFASERIAGTPGWEAVIAHEMDHARHRDPLARLAARFAVTLHAPGIASWIVRELSRAQELAADEHAASEVGERLEVAEQIVAFAKEAARTPPAAAAFADDCLTDRVETLLRAPRYVRGPSFAHGALALALSGALTGLAATSIHHELEALLSLLV